jgi:hypothetical protein
VELLELLYSFDPSQAVRNPDGTFFQWLRHTEINQLAGRNPLSLMSSLIILVHHIEYWKYSNRI